MLTEDLSTDIFFLSGLYHYHHRTDRDKRKKEKIQPSRLRRMLLNAKNTFMNSYAVPSTVNSSKTEAVLLVGANELTMLRI
jgi:hypothetical protein